MGRKIGDFAVNLITGDDELEIEFYDSEDDSYHYIYVTKTELEEMLAIWDEEPCSQ